MKLETKSPGPTRTFEWKVPMRSISYTLVGATLPPEHMISWHHVITCTSVQKTGIMTYGVDTVPEIFIEGVGGSVTVHIPTQMDFMTPACTWINASMLDH